MGNNFKNVVISQEYEKNSTKFVSFNDNVYSADFHGNAHANMNVDTDVCKVMNLQDENYQGVNTVFDTNGCNVINLQDVEHQSTNTAGEAVSLMQGELQNAQDGSQPNNGGGCVLDNIDNDLAYLVGEKQGLSLCNSNCVPVNIVNHNFSVINSSDWHYANFQYTNWHYYSVDSLNHVHIIFVTPQGSLQGKFYYLVGTQKFGSGQLFHCDSLPEGSLEILCSRIMLLYRPHMVETYTDNQKHDAKCTAENFYQDCKTYYKYHMSYEQFMDRLILSLIERQDKLSAHKVDNDHAYLRNEPEFSVCDNILTPTDKALTDMTTAIPNFFDAHTGCNSNAVTDFNDKNKTKGFLSLEETNFEFIGPDRDLCEYRNIDQVIKIAEIIKETGLPNYKQARFPIKSDLNLPAWEKYLADYPDKRIFQYLKFGFPLSLTDPDVIHNQAVDNHFSALQYPVAIQQYLDKEMEFGAILGPTPVIPSPQFHCSPLLTRPKDLDKRRVILNLSYPKGSSLNDNVDKFKFDGKTFSLKFPTVDDICQEICDSSTEVLLSKIDIARAFRNLRVDPADALKFGISWKGQYYLDLGVAFGWIHGSSSFQLVADVITHIMKHKGFQTFAYIDDFMFVNSKPKAQQAFDTLTDLLQELGLPMNADKRTPPTRSLTCLGICIDIENNTLSIDSEKIEAIYEHCVNIIHRKTISRRQLQSLLGKLLYLHKCVKPARAFVNRILATFRQNPHNHKFPVSTEMKQDIQWFLQFLPKFNGVTILKKDPIKEPHTLHIDASLTGLGGVWNKNVYSTPVYTIPGFCMTIVHWEMFNILLALRVWGNQWKHSIVKFYCDNLAVVQVVQTNKTKDPFLAACIRNIWLITATQDIEIQIQHVKGANNTIADLLSRIFSDKAIDLQLWQDLQQNYQWFKVPVSYFNIDLNI